MSTLETKTEIFTLLIIKVQEKNYNTGLIRKNDGKAI